MLRTTKSATKIQRTDYRLSEQGEKDIKILFDKVIKQQQWQFKRILSKCYLLESKTQYLQQLTNNVSQCIKHTKRKQQKRYTHRNSEQFMEEVYPAIRTTLRKTQSILSAHSNRKKGLIAMSIEELIEQIMHDYTPEQILNLIKTLEIKLNSLFQKQSDKVIPLSVQEMKIGYPNKKSIQRLKQKVESQYSKQKQQKFKKQIEQIQETKNKEICNLKRKLIEAERKLVQEKQLNQQLGREHQEIYEKANQTEITLRKQIITMKKDQPIGHTSRNETQQFDIRSQVSSFVGRIIKRNVVVLSGKKLKDLLQEAQNKIQNYINKQAKISQTQIEFLRQQTQELKKKVQNLQKEQNSCNMLSYQSEELLHKSVLSYESKKSLTNSNTARSNERTGIELKLKSRLNLCQKQLTIKQKQIEELQQQLSCQFHSLSKKVLQAQAKFIYKQQELNKSKATAQILQSQITQLTQKLKFIQQQLSKHERVSIANKKEFEQKIKQKEAQYQNIISTYRQVLKQSQQREESILNKLYSSKSNGDLLKKELQSKLNNKEGQVQKIKNQYHNLAATNKKMGEKLIKLQNKIQQGCECCMILSTKQTQHNISTAKKQHNDVTQKKFFQNFLDELKQKVSKLQQSNEQKQQKIVKMNRQLLKYKKQQLSKNILKPQSTLETQKSCILQKETSNSQLQRKYSQLLSKYTELEKKYKIQNENYDKTILHNKRKISELELTIKQISRINSQRDQQKQSEIQQYKDEITKLVQQQVKLTKQIANLQLKLASTKNIFRNVLQIWENQTNLEEDLVDNLKLFGEIVKCKNLDQNFRKNHLRIYRRFKGS